MDVTQQYSIAYKGLKNGEHHFDFEVDAAFFEAFENSEIRGGKCAVRIDLNRAETLLTLDVTIEGDVIVACDRCLEDCSVAIDYQNRLQVKFSDEVHDDFDGEVLWLSPAEDRVELAQYIYESIILSLPYQRVHPEGKCDPEMIARFRIVSGAEFEQLEHEAESHPAEADAGAWAKLAALKEQLESEDSEK